LARVVVAAAASRQLDHRQIDSDNSASWALLAIRRLASVNYRNDKEGPRHDIVRAVGRRLYA
jgi:hypothetical protein